MTSIEDARERLEAAIAKLPHPEGTAKIGRAMFSVEDVRTLLAASRREPSEHDCEFGCASDLDHLQRAYDELKAEYADFRRDARTGAA